MYQPPIVNFPVFSVTWSTATDANGGGTPAVLTAGGGGAGNTGVGNKIALIAVKGGKDKPSHAIACELETSPETCNCVASSDNGQLMAAAFGKNVRIYANNPSGFHELAVFRADHAEKESGINSMAFTTGISVEEGEGNRGGHGGMMLLATGGEDGILRVWELSADRSNGHDDEGQRGDRPASMSVALLAECKGHVKPVTCVKFRPSAALILTASKDGTCRLWDWRRSAEAALLPTTSGLPATGKGPTMVMCRSCCFSPTKPDSIIFSVQSGPRGKSYVTEWKYETVEGAGAAAGGGRREALATSGGGGGVGRAGAISCTVLPLKVACVSPHPATTLSVRSDGKRFAVGNVEGTVLVYRLPGFAKVMEYPAHDLPVTGLGFVPGVGGVELGGYDLLAGSADYKITLFKSQGSAMALATRQTLGFLWSMIVSLLTFILWTLRSLFSLTLTAIPLFGLVVLGLAVVYRPDELLGVVNSIFGEWGAVGAEGGLEDVESVPIVI